MKQLVLAFVLMLSAGVAHAVDFDGCFQLLDAGVMYPAICLSGTIEEGIGGAGVRMAIFDTNTSRLKACLRSTSSSMDEDEFVFYIDNRRELVLSNFDIKSGTLSGDALVGRTPLKFVKLANAPTLLSSARAGNCN
ncbi:MAG: hypothetical protein EOP05_05020 [Proteobacteria bacterium]|nr:MAG: hypothetical protein EOP05_05020 [Pseudomonadota bacterium]